MPRTYKRRNYGKRRYRRRSKKASGWGGTALSVAKQALSMANFLRSVINVEYKKVYTSVNTTPITNTPANMIRACLNLCAQGDADNQHNGSSVRSQTLAYKFGTQYNASSANKLHRVRWQIVAFPEAEGAYPDPTKQFQDQTVFESFRNNDYPNYVKVLRQGHMVLDEYHQAKMVSGLIHFTDHVTWTGTGAVYTDISKNSLWLQIWSDQSTNCPSIIESEFKWSFTDN